MIGPTFNRALNITIRVQIRKRQKWKKERKYVIRCAPIFSRQVLLNHSLTQSLWKIKSSHIGKKIRPPKKLESSETKTLMGKTKLLSISFFFFHVLTTFGVVSVQSSCSGGKWFFKRGSTYEVNRFLALSYLASNVSVSNQDGFSTTWVGQGLNRVYALGMCIPGTEPDTCNRCIMSGSRKVIRSCPNQTEAFLYNHLQNTSCLVRYSNRPFGSLDLSLIETEFETNRDLPLNSTEFDMAWEALMLCAIGKASSVEHEPSSRAKYFAIDVSQPTSVVSMYAFVLCSKDISPWNCSVCLRRNVDDYSSCCRGKQGSIQRPSCFMRWDLFPFDGLFDTSSAPPPHEPLRLAPQKQDITTKKGRELVLSPLLS